MSDSKLAETNIKEEEKETAQTSKPALPPPTAGSNSYYNRPGLAEPGPPSALPSQFAQNLPSPSTFYPEFYQQNELPSPLNFSQTPVVANNNAFSWPPPHGQRDYRPSPLKPELL